MTTSKGHCRSLPQSQASRPPVTSFVSLHMVIVLRHSFLYTWTFKVFTDRFDRLGSFPNDNGEKDGSISNNMPSFDRVGLSVTNISNNNTAEFPSTGIVTVQGCGNSDVAKMLNDRWAAVMHSYNDPSMDPAEKPVVYSSSGGGPGWGSSKLAYQSSVMDFLAEMSQAIRRANINQVNTK